MVLLCTRYSRVRSSGETSSLMHSTQTTQSLCVYLCEYGYVSVQHAFVRVYSLFAYRKPLNNERMRTTGRMHACGGIRDFPCRPLQSACMLLFLCVSACVYALRLSFAQCANILRVLRVNGGGRWVGGGVSGKLQKTEI